MTAGSARPPDPGRDPSGRGENRPAGRIDAAGGGRPAPFVSTPNAERYLLEADNLRRRQLRSALLHGSSRTWRDRRRIWPAVVAGLVVVAIIAAAIAIAGTFQAQQRRQQEQEQQRTEQQGLPEPTVLNPSSPP